MKKIFIGALLLAIAITLAACGAPKGVGQKADQGEAFNGSIEDLINRGKSAKCVLQAKEGESITSGTTYISGKKARSDFQTPGAGEADIASHYISDGTWMYSWNDTYKDQAIKLNIDEMQKSEFKSQANTNGADNYEEKMDYKCYSWSADQSFFAPPTDINFTDYTQMMNQLQQQTQGLNANLPAGDSAMCAQCEQIKDAQGKTQCKQSLGCK
jgi:predicted small secreted protein